MKIIMMEFKKKTKSKTNNKRSISIKTKILIIPLIIVLIGVAIMAGISSYIARESLLDEMRSNGFLILEKVIERIQDNTLALETIENLFDEKIKLIGETVILNNDKITNNFLREVAQKLGADEINWIYNGEIINSNIDEYVGWIAPQGHPIYEFLHSNNIFTVEEIRQDAISGEYKLYGYVRKSDNYFVQIGINADVVQDVTNKFSYQSILQELASDEDIIYALFIDKNLKAVAHSNRDRIGIELNDEGSKTAAIDGKAYASEYFYEAEGIMVYDVLLPVVINGQHMGGINIGFSMANIQQAINKNIKTLITVGIVILSLMALVLYNSSKGVAKVIQKLKEDMKLIASGDLSISQNEEVLSRKDEIGQMAKSVDEMIKSMRDIVYNIREKSNEVTTNSESLAATSQEMSASSQEVATTMQQVAQGATNQAQDLGDIVNLLTELTNNIENVYKELEKVKGETENTENKANIGKGEMDVLIKSIEDIKNAFELVVGKVERLTHSVKEISGFTEIISSISEQTNLLALNAAIEAARAGEHGRGFAVVAEEVRKLAEESRQSTEKIVSLVNSITKDTDEVITTSKVVEESVKEQAVSVQNTVKSFGDILISVENIAPLMKNTYSAMEEIVKSKDIVIEKVEGISAVAQENSAATEEVAASSEELTASSEEVAATAQNLSQIAIDLMETVNKFKI